MIGKAKLALIAALTVTRLATTPAFGHSFDEDNATGNVLPLSYSQLAPEKASYLAAIHAARRNGTNSFAMEPRAQSDSRSRPNRISHVPPFDPRGTSDYPWGPGYNFPYPDRPYGDPDHW